MIRRPNNNPIYKAAPAEGAALSLSAKMGARGAKLPR